MDAIEADVKTNKVISLYESSESVRKILSPILL